MNELATLLTDAVEYPLPMRIAAKLHLSGTTSKDYWAQVILKKEGFKLIPDPIKWAVYNSLNDIERKGVTPRLKELANRI